MAMEYRERQIQDGGGTWDEYSRVRYFLDDNQARRFYEWRQGIPAWWSLVDEVLVRMGLHISMVPDDLWIEGGPGGRANFSTHWTPEEKHAIITQIDELQAAGYSQREACAEIGVSDGSIRQWRRQVRESGD
jgi:hypothetical protein